MKKSTLALLTSIIAFAPLTALAQDSQTSIQSNTNSAAAIGTGNVVVQDANQTNVQDQFGWDVSGYESPDAQTSVQVNANEAAAVGHGNFIDQNADQTSIQRQTDLDAYLPY